MKNNIRKLSQILEDYTKEDIRKAQLYPKIERIMIDRIIGMLRGSHKKNRSGNRTIPHRFAFIDGREREIATIIVEWAMGRDLINVDAVDINYCLTHENVNPLKLDLHQQKETASLSRNYHAKRVAELELEIARIDAKIDDAQLADQRRIS